MLSNKEIICPNNLLDTAHKKKGVKAAIVNAGMPLPMLSVQDAVKENLIEPIFIGDKKPTIKSLGVFNILVKSLIERPRPNPNMIRAKTIGAILVTISIV